LGGFEPEGAEKEELEPEGNVELPGAVAEAVLVGEVMVSPASSSSLTCCMLP